MSFHNDSFHQPTFDPRIVDKYEKALVEAVEALKKLIRVQIDEEGLEGKRQIIKNLKVLIDDLWEEEAE